MHDRLIGAVGAEPEGMQDGLRLQLGRDRQQVMQQLFRGLRVVGHRFQDRGQARLQLVQAVAQTARAPKAQHRHGAIGLQLDQAMHQAPDAAVRRAGPHEDREPHPAVRVDAEITRDHRGLVQHPDRGQAVAREPAVDAGQRLGRVIGQQVDLDHHRRDALARRGVLPGVGKDRRCRRIERTDRKTRRHRHIGHELGVALPFQFVTAKLALIVAVIGIGAWTAMAADQLAQMRQILRSVAVGGVARLLERHEDRGRRRGDPRRGPGMQFVDQRITQGMFCGRVHLPLLKTGQRPLPHFKTTATGGTSGNARRL